MSLTCIFIILIIMGSTFNNNTGNVLAKSQKWRLCKLYENNYMYVNVNQVLDVTYCFQEEFIVIIQAPPLINIFNVKVTTINIFIIKVTVEVILFVAPVKQSAT